MVLFFEINKKLEPLSWVHDHNIGRYYRAGEHNKNSDGDGYCLPSFLKKECPFLNFQNVDYGKNEINFAFQNSLCMIVIKWYNYCVACSVFIDKIHDVHGSMNPCIRFCFQKLDKIC